MKRSVFFAAIAGLLAAATIPMIAVGAQIGQSDPNRTPVLLELFTSEGCSSCPPADKLLQVLDKNQTVANADVIVLSEHVDYWNHGGWSDPYSSAAFSDRQRDYASKLGLDSVYTPQLIVDGTAEFVGSNAAQARTEITKAAASTKLPITLSNVVRASSQISLHLKLGGLPTGSGKATIYLALADNEDRSQVARGENAGRSLIHVAVVRTLMPVGTLGNPGFSKDLALPFKSSDQHGLRVVAFVQDQASRKILAVTQQKL